MSCTLSRSTPSQLELGLSRVITEVIRPAAVLAEGRAVAVIQALGKLDIASGGVWNATPGA
jgi:hypothetical protein